MSPRVRSYASDPEGVEHRLSGFGDHIAVPDAGYFFKETINGRFYGHLEGLDMNAGERVRWYVMANTNFEIHAPHWHGNVVTVNHMRTDVAALLPMGMLVADMQPDNPGTWLFHCHVSAHLRMGMQAFFTVGSGEELVALR